MDKDESVSLWDRLTGLLDRGVNAYEVHTNRPLTKPAASPATATTLPSWLLPVGIVGGLLLVGLLLFRR